MRRLLAPRSIAVFGGGWAENVIRQCRASGYKGAIWPVHPTRREIAGVPCFAGIEALPGVPDAAFVGVNRHATLEVLATLSAMGCGGAISFASGFAETGEAALQAAFLEASGEMPVLGPNCYGLLNCLDGAMIWPDEHGCVPVARGVAVLTQSSNIGMTLTMQRRGLPIAYLACLGNAAKVGLAELAEAMLADPRVTALGVYLEGVGDAVAFARVAARARAAGKGIVALKAGHSDAGRQVAASHTASLAGDAAVSSAYLRQIGVGEVRTLPQLIETLKILHISGPLQGRSLVSVSCSGGEAGLVADAAEARELTFPPFPTDVRARLAGLLGPLVTLSNPLDYHTFIWGDGARMADVFSTAAEAYDGALFVIDQPRPDRCDVAGFEPAFEAIMETRRRGDRPVFAVASLPEAIDETMASRLMEADVVPLLGIEEALAALEAASVPAGGPDWVPTAPRPHDEADLLDEADGKLVLKEFGIGVPRGRKMRTLNDEEIADLSAPFAVKGLGFAHKSEAGAVRLNVMALGDVGEMPGPEGYLVEEMVSGGLAEMLVSVSRDPVYGLSITMGFGGIEAELLRDTVTLVAPVIAADVDAALRRLRMWPRLDGYRGRPAADVAAIVDVVMRLQAGVLATPELVDIEINPLIVRESGAVAADALIRREN